jgi:signal peptidase I
MERGEEGFKTTAEITGTYFKAILAALLIAWTVRFFGIEAYRIPNSAMSPTLLPGDTVFVTKWDYSIKLPLLSGTQLFQRMPERGDIVVFETRGRASRETVKRVIGAPGDRIQIRQGEILLNGSRISDATLQKCGVEKLPPSKKAERATSHGVCLERPLLPDRPEVTLGAQEFFVAPDLRSEASLLPPPHGSTKWTDEWERKDLAENAWGVIQQEQLLGQARWLWLSIIPPQEKPDAGWTSRIRWNRMLRRIDSIGRS